MSVRVAIAAVAIALGPALSPALAAAHCDAGDDTALLGCLQGKSLFSNDALDEVRARVLAGAPSGRDAELYRQAIRDAQRAWIALRDADCAPGGWPGPSWTDPMNRRFTGPRLVVASHNAGKVREIGDLLRPFGVETVSAGALGLPVPAETEQTFEGNARIKSHAASCASGLPALADDSGIAIEALDGRPGVHTADWAETPSGRDYMLAMRRAWDELEALDAPEPRRARFVCCLSLAWPDGHDESFLGTTPGRLVWPPRGDLGFGYDPMFCPDGHARTFAEMLPEQKHRISHRADAFRQLVAACFEPAAADRARGSRA